MTILKEEAYAELEIGNHNLKKELEHSIKFAWSYAKEGDVNYTLQCLQEADEFSMESGKHVDQKLKNDILRIAYKRGVKRQLENAKLYEDDNDVRDSSLKYAEEFTKEILKHQRSVKDMPLGNRIVYRLKYGKVSDEELQKRFDSGGIVYDSQSMADYKEMSKELISTRKRLTGSKPQGLKGLFGRIRKPIEGKSQTEKTATQEAPYLSSMPKDYETSVREMLDTNYKLAQDDAKSGNVDSVILNIENVKRCSQEIGAVVPEDLGKILKTAWKNDVKNLLKEAIKKSKKGHVAEAEESLTAALDHLERGAVPNLEDRIGDDHWSIYKNGADYSLRKAKSYAKRGMFDKAKEKLEAAQDNYSRIQACISTEEAEGILKTAYTNGMASMFDSSMKMAQKGKVKAAMKRLDLSNKCANYLGTSLSDEKKKEVLDIAYENETVRLFSEAEQKAGKGLLSGVKRALKTAEYDANQIGRSVLEEKKKYLLRTAAMKRAEMELEKAEIRGDAGEVSLSKRYLKNAGKLADEVLDYQRSVKEMPLGNRISYWLRYGSSDDELQKKFDDRGLKYDTGIAMKLKEKVRATKDEMSNQKRSRFGRLHL